MRFLDIIIPQYGETAQTVETALNSIAMQKDVDFNEIGVFLINDHSKNQIKSTTLKKFPQLNITYLINDKNMGPGLTRQRGIDLSNAQYVTFLDADDVFYDETVLNDVFQCLKRSQYPNVLFTNIFWEFKDYDKIGTTILTPKELMSLHGLFVKKDWLEAKKIRFHPNLFYYEDSFFTSIINAWDECYYYDKISYVWKCNFKSMTKKKKYEVVVTHFDDFINSGLYTYLYCQNNSLKTGQEYLQKTIVDGIFSVESNFFDFEELKEEKLRCEDILYKMILEHKELFDDEEKISYLSEKSVKNNEKHNCYYESYMDYYQFVDYMKNRQQ